MLEPGTIENDVLVGRNGYLFLAGGAHRVLDIVNKGRLIRQESFDNFRSNLQGRIGWASARGIEYLHVIMPDKQSIIPEEWPIPELPLRIGVEYIKRNADIASKILYPAAVLGHAKQKAISKVDTHLRDYGTILVTALMVEVLSNENQEDTRRRLIANIKYKSKPVSGDLGKKLNPAVEDIDEGYGAPIPGLWLHNNLSGGNDGIIDLRFNQNALYDKRVVLFGDSFGREIARFLQFWYKEVYFFRTGFFHEDIANYCQPDVLITENVERYMDVCTPDEHRPNVLLQPLSGNKPYNPPAQFIDGLNAILSFPRKPYQNFISRIMPKDKSPSISTKLQLLQSFDHLSLMDYPPSLGLLMTLEEPKALVKKLPNLVVDISGHGMKPNLFENQHVHGSYLVQRNNHLLFGQNHLVNSDGLWACESRSFKEQFINYFMDSTFQTDYPGHKPFIETDGEKNILKTSHLKDDQIVLIDGPVFLATPLEPDNYDRWLTTVATKAGIYKKFGESRKFFCRVDKPWQRPFLKSLGIENSAILPHDPGRTYICTDLITVEYSISNMTIRESERTMFFELVTRYRKPGLKKPKLYVSKEGPDNRIPKNESELAAMLSNLGFLGIKPQNLTFEEQITIFSGAEQIVSLGGAGVCNAVFCAPGTDILIIEESDSFSHVHSQLLSSLDFRNQMIFGQQIQSELKSAHTGWSVDVEQARAAIIEFMYS